MAPSRTARQPSHRAAPVAPRRAHRAERPAPRRPDQRVFVSAVVAGNALVLGGVLMAAAPTAGATEAVSATTSAASPNACLPGTGTGTWSGTWTGTWSGPAAGTTTPTPTASATTPAPSSPAPSSPAPTPTRTTSAPAPSTPAPSSTAPSSTAPAPTTPAPAPSTSAPSASAPAPSPSAPSSSAPSPSAPSTPAVRTVDPAAFGARGDGTTDDSAALQRALDSLVPGDVLALQQGKTYAHASVLRVRRDGVTIAGGGTLKATRAATTALWVESDDVTVRDIALTSRASERRGGTWDDTTLLLKGTDDAVVERVSINGSTAAGIMVTDSTDFTLTGVSVRDTLADGIHITDGSSRGTITDARVTNSGDDGIAVVSYRGSGGIPAVSHVDVVRPTVDGTSWGRGLSVVGGTDIAFTDVDVRASDAAGVYIASEANWGTDAPTRISVTGGTLTGTNKSKTVDHGAVLVFSGDAARPASDISITGLTLDHTADRASRETGVLGAAAKNVVFRDIRILGGTRAPFVSNNPASGWTLIGWTKDGAPLADRRS